MCSTVIADLTALPDVHVVTTRDLRLPHPADARDPMLIYESVKSAEDEKTAFDRLVMASDATLVIAPETNGELDHRVQRVIDRGKRVLNCQPEAIRLCADKLKLAEHFAAHKIPTIRTLAADLGSEPWGLAARGKRGQKIGRAHV